MTLAPDTSVPPRRPTTVPLGGTDPDAIAAFLRPGLSCDDAFWRRVHHRCDHCQETGTTASGALWRVSLADDCTQLYYLHSQCLTPYKAAHSLQSVEGRLPLRRLSTVGESPLLWNWHEDQARIRRESDEAGMAERDARTPSPAAADGASAPWRTRTVTDPTDGPLTTLYSPAGHPTAYAAGVDDAALRRVADRLNMCTLCEKQAMTLPICSTSSTARHGRSCWLQ